ncbi:MAG: alpha/beta hydrolase [Gammaproteobacteria bacterium]|nr:alpha/beta hydrolase [Gammaproteobacteria bacterium]
MIIDNSSPSLIFLPGWGFPSSMWKNIVALINHHQSHVSTCVELSDALSAESFPPKAVLIGWSLGGLIAMKHCLRYPGRYQKLILINSAPYFSKFTGRYKHLAENNFSHFKKNVFALGILS